MSEPTATQFDNFLEELSTFLEEVNPAVDDHWHEETLHMLTDASIQRPCQVIVEHLTQQFPRDDKAIPSAEWIRLQFWPRNHFCHSALYHTGHFNVKFAVQIWQLRMDHPDAKYYHLILKYARQFSCRQCAFAKYRSQAAEDNNEYGGEENRMSEISAVTDHYRKFMFGTIARRYKFCDVQLLCSLIIMYHLSCWSLDACQGKCISLSREFACEVRGEFCYLRAKLTYL